MSQLDGFEFENEMKFPFTMVPNLLFDVEVTLAEHVVLTRILMRKRCFECRTRFAIGCGTTIATVRKAMLGLEAKNMIRIRKVTGKPDVIIALDQSAWKAKKIVYPDRNRSHTLIENDQGTLVENDQGTLIEIDHLTRSHEQDPIKQDPVKERPAGAGTACESGAPLTECEIVDPAAVAVCQIEGKGKALKEPVPEEVMAIAHDWVAMSTEQCPSGKWNANAFADGLMAVMRGSDLNPEGLADLFKFIRRNDFWRQCCLSPKEMLTRKNGKRKLDSVVAQWVGKHGKNIKNDIQEILNTPSPW